MKKLLILAGFTGLLVSCGQSGDNNTASNVPVTPAASGKAVFISNCAMCHNPVKDATGPALAGVVGRWGGDKGKIKAFIRNSAQVIASDPNGYAAQLNEKWHRIAMPAFSNLSDADIDNLIDYVDGGGQH